MANPGASADKRARGKTASATRREPIERKVTGRASRNSATSVRPAAGSVSGAARNERSKSKLPKGHEKAQKLRERDKLQKQREREKLQKQRERDKLQKQHEREKLQKQREREKLQKQRERDKLQKQHELEREKLQKQRERDKRQKLREQESRKLEKRRGQEAKRHEQQQARAQAKLDRERELERKREAREAQRAAERREREEERARLRAQKEAEREEARRLKEEEKARKDAEREAYRKAKEAERERLRAAREAARRALEGRVAEATRQANKLGAGRSATARVYHPAAIPDQSGTTRKVSDDNPRRRMMGSPTPPPPPSSAPSSPAEEPFRSAHPPAKPEPPARIDERYMLIEQRLRDMPESFQREYRENLDMSWIYHDSALEGVVYTFQELKTAIDPNITVVPDSSLQPVCEEIRRHKAAIELARELGDKKRAPISVDDVKRLYLTLHPEEGDLKTVKYRKDIPQHRLYFHEYAAPDKIAPKVRQIVDWIGGPEAKKLKDPIRIATRAHYDLLRVFPFPQDCGKVARLLLNILLLRAGYPPAIIHSTERQRYYDALRGTLPVIVTMVTESITNALQSIEKLLDESLATQAEATKA